MEYLKKPSATEAKIHRRTAARLACRPAPAQTILKRILRGIVPIGGELSRRKLAVELGMSIIPVSEALLQRLQNEGIVETQPRVGTRVRIPTAIDVRDNQWQNAFYGEFLLNAQGEDVVAGIRTPLPISTLAEAKPKMHKQLMKIRATLEKHYHDMQDIEFTIENDKLYMLQTRNGKRTGFAAVKIAVDMVDEHLITPKDAIERIDPDQLNQLLRPTFDPNEKAHAIKAGRLLAKGLNAGPGAATGKVVFSAGDAELWKKRGERVILVRIETSPEDIRGMDASEGILTARGGMTSHAALVARQMGKVCVAGCGALNINYKSGMMEVKGEE